MRRTERSPSMEEKDCLDMGREKLKVLRLPPIVYIDAVSLCALEGRGEAGADLAAKAGCGGRNSSPSSSTASSFIGGPSEETELLWWCCNTNGKLGVDVEAPCRYGTIKCDCKLDCRFGSADLSIADRSP